ncbi:D-isomer specific 2-hydroxyacid dehydrogenase [Lenzites betulinus]|nr:D-isomer specific 2-hydroxyacid dehydrogenase [Lenzites betulinus]
MAVSCDIVWAKQECEDLLKGLADVIPLDSSARADFLTHCAEPGGKYADVVGIFHTNVSVARLGPFDRALVQGLPRSVKWIAHKGAGYDKIDVAACKERGIFVSNTPGAVDDATATAALYLVISSLRLFAHAEQDLRAGKWKASHRAGAAHDLTGRTLAILGLGGIGLRLASLAHAFPMRVVYHNRRPAANAPAWCEYFPAERLDEMLAQTDVLSVHVPLNAETEGLVGETMLRALKRGAVVVNTARGKVIDEAALIRALEDGHVGAVGLDVFPDEPEVNPRLLEFPNATLLPHVGAATSDTQRIMEVRALTNIRDFFTTGMGRDLVPEYRQ